MKMHLENLPTGHFSRFNNTHHEFLSARHETVGEQGEVHGQLHGPMHRGICNITV